MSIDELRTRYQQAVAAKIAAGHMDYPDCECPPCTEERNLWFQIKHFYDDDDETTQREDA